MDKSDSSDTEPIKSAAEANLELSDAGKVAVATLAQTEKSPTPAEVARGPPVDEDAILHGFRLITTFMALMAALSVIALDQTILGVALPTIGAYFNAFDKAGWISSAFVLTQSATILPFGALCRIHKPKWILLFSLFIFELGSLVCGVSPNVIALIFGRALAGIGAAGLFASMITIMAQITTLADRPKYMAFFGVVFGLSSVIGPLIGGAFTEKVTWRWCFYLNLPVGGAAVIPITFLLKASNPLGWREPDRSARTLLRKTLRLDWFGAAIFFAATVLLVLAFQWAGVTKPWGSAAVICSLVFSIVLYLLFFAWQYYMGDERAILPPQIWKSKSVYALSVSSFFVRFVMLMAIYEIPVFYQAVRGDSAVNSAVNLFPFVLVMIFTLIIGGQLISRVIGRYWHFLILGPVFQCIGGGLLITLKPDTSTASIVGFQILLGVGVGLCMQNSNLAYQAEFKDTPRLIAQASALGMMWQQLGGTVALAASQSVLNSLLEKYLPQYAPGVNVESIKLNPLAIYSLPSDQVAGATYAYAKSLDIVFALMPAAAGIALIATLFVKDIRISPGRAGAKKLAAAAKAKKDLERADSSEKIGIAPSEADSERTAVELPSRTVSESEKV